MKLNHLYFSIIIPCHNSQDFIFNTIESLLKQNRNDFEIIVIDDCSTDSTLLKLDEIKNDKVRIFVNEVNSGPNFSRNLGIEKSRGKFVLFLDSDDNIVGNALEVLYKYSLFNGFDFLSFGFDFISSETQLLKKLNFENRFLINDEIIKEYLTGKIYSVCWNKLYSRDFLIDNNIRFIPDKVHGRDSVFTLDCSTKANKVLLISEILYLSLVRNGSFSRSFTLKNIYSLIDNFNLLNKKIDSRNIYFSDFLFYKSKHIRYILIYASFKLNFIDYCKAILLIKKTGSLNVLFSSVVLRRTKFLHIFISGLILMPFFIIPISWILNKLNYKPY